jgi:hypothetical protein
VSIERSVYPPRAVSRYVRQIADRIDRCPLHPDEWRYMCPARRDGSPNHETYVVARWIGRDSLSRQRWREAAAEAEAEAVTCREPGGDPSPSDDAPLLLLADWLKEEFEDQFPLDPGDVYSDLLNSALRRVEWTEIARTLLGNQDVPKSVGRQ